MSLLSDNIGPLCATVGAVSTLAGAGALYYLLNIPEPSCMPSPNLDDQSYELQV